ERGVRRRPIDAKSRLSFWRQLAGDGPPDEVKPSASASCALSACSLLVRLRPLFRLTYLARGQKVESLPMVEPSFFNPTQASCCLAEDHLRTLATQLPLQHPGDQRPHLRYRQCRCPFFSPAAFPASGTTWPAAPGSGGDASPARSAPRSRPDRLPPWHAANTLRPGARPWPPARTPPTWLSPPRWTGSSRACTSHPPAAALSPPGLPQAPLGGLPFGPAPGSAPLAQPADLWRRRAPSTRSRPSPLATHTTDRHDETAPGVAGHDRDKAAARPPGRGRACYWGRPAGNAPAARPNPGGSGSSGPFHRRQRSKA